MTTLTAVPVKTVTARETGFQFLITKQASHPFHPSSKGPVTTVGGHDREIDAIYLAQDLAVVHHRRIEAITAPPVLSYDGWEFITNDGVRIVYAVVEA